MRALAALAAGVLVGATLATSAFAATLEWQGTLSFPFRTLPSFEVTGTGVATVNGSGGRGHLNTLRLAGGLTGSTTIPLTDPHHPTLVTLWPAAQLGTGTLAPISGGGPLTSNTLPVHGNGKLCVLFPGCGNYLPIPLTLMGKAGVGLGGIIQVGTLSKGPAFSIVGAPWTIGVASVTEVPTENGGTTTVTAQGFAHGPASGTSSTAALSGVIQLVTPIKLIPAYRFPEGADILPLFGILKLRFIPEPEMLLLLGWGAAALLLFGRRRFRS
jgi:hypothetical protein